MAAENYENVQYNARLYIGENRQPFKILFDTGSGWFWVKDSKCPTCHGKKYDCDGSPSCQKGQLVHKIQYGRGMVEGVSFTETMAFDDDKEGFSFNHTGLRIGQMAELDNFKADGLIGLGFTSTPYGLPSFVDSLHQKNFIEKRQFSIYLSDNPKSEGIYDSELIFGGYDEKYLMPNETNPSELEQFTYAPLLKKHEEYNTWTVGLDAFYVSGLPLRDVNEDDVLVDSGTSDILLPERVLQAVESLFNKQVPTARCSLTSEPFVCTCDNTPIEKFPTLSFVIGGRAFDIPPQAYISRTSDGCLLSLGVNGSNRWVLGQIFMRKFYTLFDWDGKRIGIARARDFAKRQDHVYLVGFSLVGIVLIIAVGVLLGVYTQTSTKGKMIERKLLPS